MVMGRPSLDTPDLDVYCINVYWVLFVLERKKEQNKSELKSSYCTKYKTEKIGYEKPAL